MRLFWRQSLFIPVSVATLLVACGDSTNPFVERLVIISGGSVTDTILARLTQPLVVEYRDSTGAVRSGVPIHIDRPVGGVALRRSLGDSVFRAAITDTTDANGQVRVYVALGIVAGLAWVRATTTTGLADSTSFTILPGALARVMLAPVDTAVHVGGSVTLRGKTFDSWGNERTDALQWSAAGDVVAATQPGTFRGSRVGRTMVTARTGAVADSIWLNVVPRGTIAAIFQSSIIGTPQYVVIFNTDGTGYQRVNIGADCAHGLQWSPAGDRLFFGRNAAPGVCFTQRLYHESPGGAATRLRPDTGSLAGEFSPRPTSDGQWIYFSGRPDHQNGEIWRVRPDGTGAERVGPASGFSDIDQHPAPSPDGTIVVYASWRDLEPAVNLRVLNTTTRAVSDLGVIGMTPSWSPNGDSLAFRRGDEHFLVAADGSGERFLANTRGASDQPPPVSWSPDGHWVVFLAPDNRLVLFEVATSMALPLGWTGELTYPSWRPGTP